MPPRAACLLAVALVVGSAFQEHTAEGGSPTVDGSLMPAPLFASTPARRIAAPSRGKTAVALAASAEIRRQAPEGGDFGKPGDPVSLAVGYQPHFAESWSGVVINAKQLWKKYLPAGSRAEFEPVHEGARIIGKLLGRKNHLGYLGDLPAILSTQLHETTDIRIIAVSGTSRQQSCW